MFCENCGAEHEKGVDFCEHCGNKLTRPGLIDIIFHGAGKNTGGITCPNCRNGEYNKNFCVKCGYNLNNVLGYFSPKGFPSDDEYYLELNKNYLKVHRNIQTEFDSTWYEFTFLYEKIEKFEITACQGKIFTGHCLKFTYKDDFEWESYPMKHFCDGKNSIKIPVNEKFASEITEIVKSNLNLEK
jgi:hypothetical protein